eukprot:449483-Rhodomonas_salina.5
MKSAENRTEPKGKGAMANAAAAGAAADDAHGDARHVEQASGEGPGLADNTTLPDPHPAGEPTCRLEQLQKFFCGHSIPSLSPSACLRDCFAECDVTAGYGH